MPHGYAYQKIPFPSQNHFMEVTPLQGRTVTTCIRSAAWYLTYFYSNLLRLFYYRQKHVYYFGDYCKIFWPKLKRKTTTFKNWYKISREFGRNNLIIRFFTILTNKQICGGKKEAATRETRLKVTLSHMLTRIWLKKTFWDFKRPFRLP